MITRFKSKAKAGVETRSDAIHRLAAEGKITDPDYLLTLNPVTFRRGTASHPMYPAWRRMVDGCTDPRSKHWKVLGGRGVTVMERWLDFDNFVDDMESTWDDDESKPALFRKIHLGRKKTSGGFNPKNAVWVTRKEAVAVQVNTRFVPTPWGKMTLHELEQYLIDHDGEDLPPNHGPYRLWVRQWDPDSGNLVTSTLIVTTISPVKFLELRKRYRLGLDLLRPTRPYGDSGERIEKQQLAQLESDRQRRERAASELGMTLAQYDASHYADGSEIEWGTVQHPLNEGKINIEVLKEKVLK